MLWVMGRAPSLGSDYKFSAAGFLPSSKVASLETSLCPVAFENCSSPRQNIPGQVFLDA